MKSVIGATILMCLAGASQASEPLPSGVVSTLTNEIHKRCPAAKIETKDGVLTAKNDTMLFTLHGQFMTGEISKSTHQEEGPNYRGFLLVISLEKGPYNGQAVVPQVLHGPYYPTFLDARSTENGKKYYRINFSYGSRLAPELYKAILETLPTAKAGLSSAGSNRAKRS